MELDFAGALKNFHNLDLNGILRIALDTLEGNWIGGESEVNRECQMLRGCCPNPWSEH